MSDSSEDEDMSRFREAVDNSFTKSIQTQINGNKQDTTKLKSERYLEEASHYNDVKVPEKMQKQIGDKISTIINKNIEYVNIEDSKPRKSKIKGGVKLFKESSDFLSSHDAEDTYTEIHNQEARKIKKKRKKREIDADDNNISENDKINAATITGDSILSKEETKCWKSRRKEKLFRYKGKGKVLTSVE